MSKIVRVLLLIFFINNSIYAQEKSFILSIDNSLLIESIKSIEAQSDYKFYYNQLDLDSIFVTISKDSYTIESIARKLQEQTKLHFSIDERGYVFITKDINIRTSLPMGFFDKNVDSIVYDDVTALDYFEQKQESNNNSLENKLIVVGTQSSSPKPGKVNLAGYVKDVTSGEPVIGAQVYKENPLIGVVTDQFGYYSITLPKGRYELIFKSIGMKNTLRQVMLYENGKLNVEMEEDVVALREVIIESEKDVNVSGMQMGLEKIDIKTIKQIPTALGEMDILKVALTLPGVQTVGESATGLNVRGGATDQNLILLNDMVIYNPAHLFGFFSAFNPDILSSVNLYKSGIPAEFGGRLSSVLEVSTRDGNKKELSGSGGLGLVTSRLTLEAPIIKDKLSLIVGGRTTYSDWILKELPNSNFSNSSASFYDANLHLSYDVNEKNSIYASGYISKDGFRLNADTLFGYQNQNAAIKWKHVFKNKFYGVLSATYNNYRYDISSKANPVNSFDMDYQINQSDVKLDFNYFPDSKHTIKFGATGILYNLNPGSFLPASNESLVSPLQLQQERGVESALYISDQYEINRRLSFYMGLRYSMFHNLGPRQVYSYPNDVSKSVSNIQDTTSYGAGEIINQYGGPEFRFSLRYLLTADASIKLSYNRMRQYIHMLSNTAAISPTDTWKLSDSHIRPQVGDQYAIGYFKNFKNNTIEASVEAYYKTMDNFLDFKSGAVLFLNPAIETDIINAYGKAYGLELMLKKMTGKLNGWVSYTYSRSLVQINQPETGDVINQGEFFPSNFDKPHDFTLVGNYRFSRRFSFSLNFTYSTGRPITLPQAIYDYEGAKRIYYSDRNQYRIPDYMRADIAFNLEGNHIVKKLNHSSWTLAVYNLLGRRNAYSVFFDSSDGVVNGYQLSIFGQPIPTLTWNFKF